MAGGYLAAVLIARKRVLNSSRGYTVNVGNIRELCDMLIQRTKMPTFPYPLALIQLSIANSTLSWSNPVWQSLTNVLGDPWAYNHGGDKSAASIHVTAWTVGKAQAVKVFINNCKSAQDPALHYAITQKDNDHEGHSSWNIWVKTSWAKWKINTLVNNILQESGCEPHDVMARLNCKSADVVSYLLIH
jgi:hypothetical protein